MFQRKKRGVTLIELCFGMTIVAVLAGLAAPGFRSSLRVAAVRAATFELLAGLQQTRGNSIVESRPGSLCPSDAAGSCLPPAASARFWRASLEPDEGSASETAVPPDSHTLPTGIVVRASRSPLKFWPDSRGATTGTLTICDALGVAPPRAIVLSLSGRARIAAAAESACH
ncbi:MAG TPA: GspH/FimT family pseudopilin [Steroidobacteraceae bacterium]|jgi:type IV fimbrial biogenesis protein FimT|nr:GspH/FimT family pseudopilin [Steroidobacteraceae bacterium]